MPQGFNGSCPSMYNFIEPLYCDVSSGPVVLEKKRQTSRATGQMNDPIYAPAFYPLVHYRLWLGSHGAGLEISDPKLKRFFFCFGSSSHYGSWALARFSNTFETWSPRKLFQCIACTQTFNDNIITFSCKSMQFPSKLMLFTYFRPPDQTFLPPTKMFLQLFWHSNYFWPPDQFFFICLSSSPFYWMATSSCSTTTTQAWWLLCFTCDTLRKKMKENPNPTSGYQARSYPKWEPKTSLGGPLTTL